MATRRHAHHHPESKVRNPPFALAAQEDSVRSNCSSVGLFHGFGSRRRLWPGGRGFAAGPGLPGAGGSPSRVKSGGLDPGSPTPKVWFWASPMALYWDFSASAAVPPPWLAAAEPPGNSPAPARPAREADVHRLSGRRRARNLHVNAFHQNQHILQSPLQPARFQVDFL